MMHEGTEQCTRDPYKCDYMPNKRCVITGKRCTLLLLELEKQKKKISVKQMTMFEDVN